MIENLTLRQKLILKIIVEAYIRSGTPVSSAIVVRSKSHFFSSATIRNECVILEKYGLLEKNYKSSARIPSAKGYRYYVDALMNFDNVDKK
jgi:heat-inducible transcriptional repressor